MARLKALRWGQGSPLVLLHGFLGSEQDWDPVADGLGRHHSCLAIDLPGHGASKNIRLTTEPAFDETVEAILNTIDGIGFDRFHLLGYSMGGRMAMHLSRHVPERLLSLTLESAHPGLTDPAEKLQRLDDDREWYRLMCQGTMEEFLDVWYRQDVFADLGPVKRAELVAARKDNDPQALAALFLGTSHGHQQDQRNLDHLLCPVQLFTGEKDTKYTKMAQAWAKQAPQLRHTVIPAVGHNIHLACPGIFVDTVRPLLAAIDRHQTIV